MLRRLTLTRKHTRWRNKRKERWYWHSEHGPLQSFSNFIFERTPHPTFSRNKRRPYDDHRPAQPNPIQVRSPRASSQARCSARNCSCSWRSCVKPACSVISRLLNAASLSASDIPRWGGVRGCQGDGARLGPWDVARPAGPLIAALARALASLPLP